MDLFGRGHIFSLSDEVLLQIIENLTFVGTGSDLIHLSQTSARFNSLTEDKKSVSSLSFRRDFRISPENLKKFFSSSLRCQNISHLNLNSCYFLSSTLLRSLLIKLKNLLSLHVADTSITASSLSTIIIQNPHLVNLSFSWWWAPAEAQPMLESHLESLDQAFARLKSLAVHVNANQYCPLDKLCCILKKCVDLERLVVVDDGIQSSVANMPGRYDLNVQFPIKLKFTKMKEYICKIDNQAYPFLMKREFFLKIAKGLISAEKLEVYWDESGCNFLANKIPQLKTLLIKPPQLQTVQVSRIQNLDSLTFLRVMDQVEFILLPDFTGLKRCAVFCNNSSELMVKMAVVPGERLEEFSLIKSSGHWQTYPPFNIIGLVRYIGFKNLRKLSVPICVFHDKPTNSKKPEESSSKMDNQETCNSFKELTDNVANTLEHLELHECDKGCQGEEVLQLIEKLPKLRRLVLSQFQVNVGKSKNIFSKIFGSCSLLEELKIHLLKPHGNSQSTASLVRDIGVGLITASKITKLSIEQPGIMESFQKFLKPAIVKCESLEKLILVDPLKSFLINKFPLQDTIDILNMNTKLSFFYLRCLLMTNDSVKKLKAQCKKVKKTKPHFIYHFQKQLEDPSGDISLDDIKDIPGMYVSDLLPVSSTYSSPVANITFDNLF